MTFLTLNGYFLFKNQNILNIHMIISFNSKLTGNTFVVIKYERLTYNILFKNLLRW